MKKLFMSILTILFVFSAICAFAGVKYIGEDKNTKGNWPTKYGKNGAIIFAIADQKDLKDITKFDDGGNKRWDWANPTNDERGLISINDPKIRLGTCMYNNPTGVITLETKLTNYQVALFVIDWDSTARVQELVGFQGAQAPANADAKVENPAFNSGVYYLWHVTGSEPFKIQITHKGGANWVISGLFVDAVNVTAVKSDGKLAITWGAIRSSN